MILLIDDEEIIRLTVQKILTSFGYDVCVAEDGLSGIETYKTQKQLINLIILDISMSKMSGKETFIALKKINADIKVIITSGFKSDERIDELLQSGASGFIAKPFTFTELITTVKKHIG
jgi:CheY-like chemotaxis protein